jgi:5'-deoxynucleotidase YfbR-like HD superfamily hydrolase
MCEGGAVERFHARPGITRHTDAAHSWGVALLIGFLSEPMPRAELLLAALTHDLAEHYTGDTPAPAKWALGTNEVCAALEHKILHLYGLNFEVALTTEELRLLKIADTMDGLLHCCREIALGNRTVVLVYNKWLGSLNQHNLTAHERKVAVAIMEIWNESKSEEGPRFDVYAGDRQ